jgi:hypothetical protein
MGIIEPMSDKHPMLDWAERNGTTILDLATAAGCSGSHLRNIFAGRKEASLSLAKRLSEASRNEIPMDAFLRPAEARI